MARFDAALPDRMLVPADRLCLVWRYFKRTHCINAGEGQGVYGSGPVFDRFEAMMKTATSLFIIRQIAQPDIIRPRQLEVRLDIPRVHARLDIGNYLTNFGS